MNSSVERKIYIAEASTLGWKPGYWPETFELDGKIWTRKGPVFSGNGEDRELAFVLYMSGASGFRVYND